jgi:hypothetical protein
MSKRHRSANGGSRPGSGSNENSEDGDRVQPTPAEGEISNAELDRWLEGYLAALPPELKPIFEVPDSDLPGQTPGPAPSPRVVHVIQIFVNWYGKPQPPAAPASSDAGAAAQTAVDSKGLMEMLSDRYSLCVKKYGPIRGALRFWYEVVRDLLLSQAGQDLWGAIQKLIEWLSKWWPF